MQYPLHWKGRERHSLSVSDIQSPRLYSGFGGLKAVLFPNSSIDEWIKLNASKGDLKAFPQIVELHRLSILMKLEKIEAAKKDLLSPKIFMTLSGSLKVPVNVQVKVKQQESNHDAGGIKEAPIIQMAPRKCNSVKSSLPQRENVFIKGSLKI
jgi:hypothetical protein